MLNTLCNQEKPGKYEKPYVMPKHFSIKTCPDCDKKRTTVCKDPHCSRPNKL